MIVFHLTPVLSSSHTCLTVAMVFGHVQVGCPEHESAASQKSPSTRPLGSVFGWMKSKLGLGRQSDSSDHNSADEAGMEKVLTEVSPEVAEEILAVASATWSRPSHDFRTGRSARTSHGSAELLRTSSEPGTVARRRRAREFARNLDFYKDMAGELVNCSIRVALVMFWAGAIW